MAGIIETSSTFNTIENIDFDNVHGDILAVKRQNYIEDIENTSWLQKQSDSFISVRFSTISDHRDTKLLLAFKKFNNVVNEMLQKLKKYPPNSQVLREKYQSFMKKADEMIEIEHQEEFRASLFELNQILHDVNQEEAGQKSLILKPVSYTHLTLPTIYSV
eukprot:TRINITY_DN13536_c0_g6_i1.p1 TRINITY_DN13536_c0_g6~~TRINITY_DN13536_c0_g6_i1.p1  ORF type:complete len:161 (-),score=26.76 TRINITY_DN13536_c0_g6_i1:17-499(-)